MLIPKPLLRIVLLAIPALALAGASPLPAAGPPGKQVPAATAAAPTATPPTASGDCASPADRLGDLAALGFAAEPAAPGKSGEGPLCRLEAATPPRSCVPGVNCHRYCACECSRIKDCNVDSDCSNHRCLSGISCC
jgi:hypothetical protein